MKLFGKKLQKGPARERQNKPSNFAKKIRTKGMVERIRSKVPTIALAGSLLLGVPEVTNHAAPLERGQITATTGGLEEHKAEIDEAVRQGVALFKKLMDSGRADAGVETPIKEEAVLDSIAKVHAENMLKKFNTPKWLKGRAYANGDWHEGVSSRANEAMREILTTEWYGECVSSVVMEHDHSPYNLTESVRAFVANTLMDFSRSKAHAKIINRKDISRRGIGVSWAETPDGKIFVDFVFIATTDRKESK